MESSVRQIAKTQPPLFHALHSFIPELEVELELVYELVCEDEEISEPARAIEDDAEIELVYEDHVADVWFAQPEDVIALTDDYVLMQTPKNWLLRGLFLASLVLTVAACIGVTTI